MSAAFAIDQVNKHNLGSSCCDAAEVNPTGIHEDGGSIPGIAQ